MVTARREPKAMAQGRAEPVPALSRDRSKL